MGLDSVWSNVPSEIHENLAPFAGQFLEEIASPYDAAGSYIGPLSFRLGSERFDPIPTVDGSIITSKTDIQRGVTFGELRQVADDKFVVGHIALRGLMSFPDARAIVFFSPTGRFMKQAIDVLSKTRNLSVVAYGDAEFSWSGAERFMEACYGRNVWFTNTLRRKMAYERFLGRPQAAVIFVRGRGTEDRDVSSVKASLRARLPSTSFPRLIHSTDTHDETLDVAEILLNPNALHFVNHSGLDVENNLLNRIPSWVQSQMSVCVDGSTALGIYGIRTPRDIDVISPDKDLQRLINEDSALDLHNEVYLGKPLSVEMIVVDPHLHFIYKRHKFMSLNTHQFFLGLSAGVKSERGLELLALFRSHKAPMKETTLRTIANVSTKFWLLYAQSAQLVLRFLPSRLAALLRRKQE